MSQTTSLLAAYLDDSGDTTGVLNLLREKYANSIATYIAHIRREWLTLNKPGPEYEKQFAALITKAGSNQPLLKKLKLFHNATMTEKNKIQQSLKVFSYTNNAEFDTLLAGIDILPEFIKELKVTNAERSLLQAKSEKALNKKGSNVFQVDADAIVHKCVDLLENSKTNIFDLAVAISLLTGRRMIEVFKTGQFIATDNAFTAIFEGQAKKRTEVSYKIPLLAPLSMIQKGLTKLRLTKNTDDLSNAEVNLRFSTSCNSAARRVLGFEKHFHDARGIYAVVCYESRMPHNLSLNFFVSKVLGHVGMQQSLNYACLHVTNVTEGMKQKIDLD